MMQHQGAMNEVALTPIGHRHRTEAEQEQEQEQENMIAQELDALYNQIYYLIERQTSQRSKSEKAATDYLIAFKKAAASRNIPFHAALKECSRRTNKILPCYYLFKVFQGKGKDHFELFAELIYAKVIDINHNDRAEFDHELRTIADKNKFIVKNALSCMDEIKRLEDQYKEVNTNDNNDNSKLILLYKEYHHLKEKLKSTAHHLYLQIDTIIVDILHKMMENADNVQKRINLMSRMRSEDVALFRHAFEIIDEAHPDGTAVLHPAAYKELSTNGYRIACSNEDLSRVKIYLKENYRLFFNRYQPDIPLFHDEISRDDMLLNKAYMKVHDASNDPEIAYTALWELYRLAIDKKLNFQEVLRRCKENVNYSLGVSQLAPSLYKGHGHLVLAAILAGVVDGKATQPCIYPVPGLENLRACVKRYIQELPQGSFPYNRETLQEIIKELDQIGIK